jgi:hypothetical protein
MNECDRWIKGKSVKRTDTATLHPETYAHVEARPVDIDEHGGYIGLSRIFYNREWIDHSVGRYVCDCDRVITNIRSVIKRGLHGIYYYASKNHPRRYMGEFMSRLSGAANMNRHTLRRLTSLFTVELGPCLTYRELTA